MAPRQKPGKSEQSVQTPPEFITAVKKFLKIDDFLFDLAADETNSQGIYHINEEQNALAQGWSKVGVQWLNPPYADITPWVKKAYEESQTGTYLMMLLPASVGSNWWRDWVHEKCNIYLLNGRLTFVGHTAPYPKDMALLFYHPPTEGLIIKHGYAIWNWRAMI